MLLDGTPVAYVKYEIVILVTPLKLLETLERNDLHTV